MDILQPFLYTGVNLTTFRFRYEGPTGGTAGHSIPTADDGRYDDDDLATVYDSLLTLYHGVRLQSNGGGSCQWSGNNLLSTLTKVSPFVVILVQCSLCYTPFYRKYRPQEFLP